MSSADTHQSAPLPETDSSARDTPALRPRPFAGADQRTPQQIERLLASVGDQNVVRFARHAARGRSLQQIAPQRFVAARRAELHQCLEVPALKDLAARFAEFLDGKELFRWPGAAEVDSAAGSGIPAPVETEPTSTRDQFIDSA